MDGKMLGLYINKINLILKNNLLFLGKNFIQLYNY